MLLSDPPPTQGDLHFRFLGFPVRIHPFFWIAGLLLGPWQSREESVVMLMLLWIVAFFVSILVHELGHAAVMRAYGFRPWITLYGLGGMASRNAGEFDRSKGSEPAGQIIISLAGPGAGFLLAASVAGIVLASGHQVELRFGGSYGIGAVTDLLNSTRLTAFVWYLLNVNILWGILNLMPIYPLDGGKIARELFLLANPHEGIQRSLWLSTIAATVIAVYLLMGMHVYATLLFGYLAYGSYKTLQAYTNQRGPW